MLIIYGKNHTFPHDWKQTRCTLQARQHYLCIISRKQNSVNKSNSAMANGVFSSSELSFSKNSQVRPWYPRGSGLAGEPCDKWGFCHERTRAMAILHRTFVDIINKQGKNAWPAPDHLAAAVLGPVAPDSQLFDCSSFLRRNRPPDTPEAAFKCHTCRLGICYFTGFAMTG